MKVIKSDIENTFKLKTDEELFKLMTDTNEEGQKAFKEFHSRYSGYLWKICLYVCRNHFLKEDIAEDIFQNTLLKAFTKAKTFKGNIGVKAWLGRIAQNEFINYYRETFNETSFSALSWDSDNNLEGIVEAEEKASQLSLNEIKINEALEKLTSQERDILMTYMRYYDPQNPQKHLPDEEMKYLCDLYSTNPTNIRQIKHRTLKKIKTLVQ